MQQTILIAAVIYYGSFLFLRWILIGIIDKMKAKMVRHIGNPKSKTMDCLIAGNLAQPEAAFYFMEDLLTENYTYVNYRCFGWDAAAMSYAIMDDIFDLDLDDNSRIRVFAISVGDQVARMLDGVPYVEIYSINPCTRSSTLQKKWLWLLTGLAPLFKLLCYGLGWLSIIPIIPTLGGRYSLMLLADQYYGMVAGYTTNPPAHTKGVICSARDEFLKNEEIKKIFPDAKIVTIDTTHGNTVGADLLYLGAMKELLKQEQN